MPPLRTGRPRYVALVVASLALLLAGLSAPAAGAAGAQDAPKLKVLTTFTILADMARNVGGDRLDVESITRPGAEIHGYEPTPDDIVKAQSADLILLNGLGLERWFEPFYSNVEDVPSVVLTEGIAPIPIAGGDYDGKPNPHAWMSPRNALVYVENIRLAFGRLDPANAATYDANAAVYSAQITGVDQQLSTSLAALPPNQRALVTCEGAFSYLTRDYGLREIYIWQVNADSEGTPQQIATVIEAVRANGVPAVFCESTINTDAQQQIAEESGARFAGVLYVDSLTEAGDAPTYLALLQYDVSAIIGGLTGTSPTATVAVGEAVSVG